MESLPWMAALLVAVGLACLVLWVIWLVWVLHLWVKEHWLEESEAYQAYAESRKDTVS